MLISAAGLTLIAGQQDQNKDIPREHSQAGFPACRGQEEAQKGPNGSCDWGFESGRLWLVA